MMGPQNWLWRKPTPYCRELGRWRFMVYRCWMVVWVRLTTGNSKPGSSSRDNVIRCGWQCNSGTNTQGAMASRSPGTIAGIFWGAGEFGKAKPCSYHPAVNWIGEGICGYSKTKQNAWKGWEKHSLKWMARSNIYGKAYQAGDQSETALA